MAILLPSIHLQDLLPTMTQTPLRLSYLLTFALCCLIGCGSSGPDFKTGTVSGTAKIGDAPFEAKAVLMFLDQTSGQAYTAPVADDGSFTIEGDVRVGTYSVYLAPPPPEAGAGDQPMAVTIDTSLPDKYWNESMTDLTVDISEGENSPTIVFEKS